jgi:hypothetical protein
VEDKLSDISKRLRRKNEDLEDKRTEKERFKDK